MATAKGRVRGKNKSADIKAELQKNPDLAVADLVKKHKVSAGLVNKIRSEMGLTKKRRKGGRPKSRPTEAGTGRHSNNGHTATEIVQAAFAYGLDKTIELLTAVRKAVK